MRENGNYYTNKLYIGAASTTKPDVYKDYCNYCSQNEVQAVSKFTFKKCLKKRIWLYICLEKINATFVLDLSAIKLRLAISTDIF